MGYRGKKAGKKNITRTIWKETERSVKREQLETIAAICGATRNTVGSIICNATLTDEYDDRTERTEHERSTSDGSTTTATAGSSIRDPTTNHRL
jgi:hypothetical protein